MSLNINYSPGNLLSGFLGYELNSLQNQENMEFASKEAAKARAENYQYNEMAADNADKRQRQQWKDMYNIEAQMKQIKNAGLSPSLMYGGTPSPGGQATGQQGGGANGTGAPTFTPIANTAGIADLMDTMASAKLKEAQANAIEEKTPVEITQLLAEAGLKEASKALAEAQTTTQELINYVKNATKDIDIKRIEIDAAKAAYETNKAYWEAKNKELEFNFNTDTYDDRVQLIHEEKANLIQDTLLKISQGKLNEQKITESKAQIDRWISQTWIEWKETDIHQQSVEIQENWYKKQTEQFYAKLAQDLELATLNLSMEQKKMIVKAVTDILQAGIQAAAMYYVGGGTAKIKSATQALQKAATMQTIPAENTIYY